MESINLWECMGHNMTKKMEPIINELALRARYGQELSIQPYKTGWLLKIFSCFDEKELKIYIDRDGGVEIE